MLLCIDGDVSFDSSWPLELATCEVVWYATMKSPRHKKMHLDKPTLFGRRKKKKIRRGFAARGKVTLDPDDSYVHAPALGSPPSARRNHSPQVKKDRAAAECAIFGRILSLFLTMSADGVVAAGRSQSEPPIHAATQKDAASVHIMPCQGSPPMPSLYCIAVCTSFLSFLNT